MQNLDDWTHDDHFQSYSSSTVTVLSIHAIAGRRELGLGRINTTIAVCPLDSMCVELEGDT